MSDAKMNPEQQNTAVTNQQVKTDQTAQVAKYMSSSEYEAQLQAMPTTYELFKKGHDLNPEAPALTYFLQGGAYQESETWSYRELLQKIHQVGNFIDSLGLEEDAVIGMLLPNLPECYAVILGVQTRHVIMPINPLLEDEVIGELLTTAKARVLITLAPFPKVDIWQKAQHIAELVPTLAHVVTMNLADHVLGKNALPAKLLQAKQGVEENGWQALFLGAGASLPSHIEHHDFASSISKQPDDKLVFADDERKRRGRDDLSSFFCTGGTTGRPKIAMRCHKNEVSNVLQARANLGDDMVGSGKNVLCGLPLFHVNALMVTGTFPFSVGGHVILATPQGYRGEGVVANLWKIIEHYQVNFFSGVPTLYSSLLNVPLAGSDVSSLDYCLCGAAPMPLEVFKQFEAQTGITILEAYGMTEGNCGSAINPRDGERKIGSIGQPFAFQPMTIAILDAEGAFERHANVEEVGVVAIRGDNVFNGYFIDSQNADIWIDDDEGHRWFNTGDLGYQDADGYVFLTGRKKELIIRGGHNIDPKLIEEPVYQFEGVEVCAAIGKPDVYAGELPILYVQPKPEQSIDTTELAAYCQAQIGERAAIPKEIHVIEAIPLTSVGKVFKPGLKRLANTAAVSEVLEAEGIEADITTPEHPKFGFITRVELKDKSQLARAQHVVGEFAIAHEVV